MVLTIKQLQTDGSYMREVSIPNREIVAVYKSEILSHLLQVGAVTRTTANKIAESPATEEWIYENKWGSKA